MAVKNTTQVLIGGKIMTLSGYESEEYLQKVAYYINNKMTYDIVINPSETTTRNITNEHKKGNLKIYKVDKDDNDLSIGAVEFDLIDYTGKIVKHLVKI